MKTRRNHFQLHFLSALTALGLTQMVSAQTENVSVDSRASIFSQVGDRDGSIDGSGFASVSILLTPGVGRVITFSNVTGLIGPGAGGASHGADGGLFTGTGVNVNSSGLISGVLDSADRTLALMGVFTVDDPAGGIGAAPARLDFTGNHSFSSLSPIIRQIFFIGDGLTDTGSGTTQQFMVPDGANYLHLGFADAFTTTGNPFEGDPSDYQDNTGSLNLNYSVPEAGIHALLCASALVPVMGRVRRRRT